ncbi:MAG TPA: T9SS type A sorting domain-containing protein [Chitinophagales bacterium]|nr:T9SS type A sorting domain-containing protein [Chitinophagales bacterium]
MRKIIQTICLFICLAFATNTQAQIINIPDANFKAKLLEADTINYIAKDSLGHNMKIDINNDGEIQQSEALLVSKLVVSNSGIASMNGIEYFTNLIRLECENNQISTFNLNNLSKLESVHANYNLIDTLIIPQQNTIRYFNMLEHNIEYLDLRMLKSGIVLYVASPKLKSLYLKNGVRNTYNSGVDLNVRNSTNLKFVCVDQSDYSETYMGVAFYSGLRNVLISYFCNSILDATITELYCITKIDFENNGCSIQDNNYPNLKIKLCNTTDTSYIISNYNGNYVSPIQTGTYTLTPQFTHAYFTVTPSSTTISLPDSIPTSFCITPNGTHHDVSVTVIPIRAARPGFSDAKYKIVLKNKGNQIESGTILFKYDENKQDYISATSTPNSIISGELTFAFSNLIPFETREITVTMRTNAPTDNPAVNAGDLLNVQVGATLDNGVRDEYIKDNFKNIKQTVVGSIDPNDKTCLEGKIATPDIIGDFVNYLIRFENTGTANAENVVVTDFIDLAKFDISTLELTSTSHSCKTVISNGNKVQFVFDNINLPFTDPNKYGYVAFKIKTKSTLVIGDSLKNTADIYFDYNLPIKTNTAATRIDNIILGTKNVTNKEGRLSVYPNPSTGNFTVNFESKGNFPITIKMMDLKGSVVFEKNINHTEKSTVTIDEKNLSNGIYLININSQKENWMQKLMIVK